MSGRAVILTGMFLAGTSVILGAFGAHWLREQLPGWFPDDAAKRLENWQTGVYYQMFHSLAMIACGGLASACWRWRGLAAALMLLGVVLFSGGLYGWVLTDQKWMVMVVPVGGLSFIAGWVCAMASILFGPRNCSSGGGCHEH
ncbi:MAG: DUF423 domain-containing protein [Planctomycetota bacterium]|jgi:uncharacterized membrane protein YgdD (TMEM256/DUF423 family)|nr:DUF423 domain-containing protein [Blastopirellula sp.]